MHRSGGVHSSDGRLRRQHQQSITPDACPPNPPSEKLRIKTVADVISPCRRVHKTLPIRSDGTDIEIMQTFLALYGYWYCNSHMRYIGVSEGKALPDGLRPFTYKKCDRCPAGTRPPVFRPMHPSQLVYDGNAVFEPDNTPPPAHHRTQRRTKWKRPVPRLRDVCTTYIPMLSHIPMSIRPDDADLFRQSLNDSVDAVEGTPYNAVQKFTKLFLLPACLFAAPKLKPTEAVGAGHHTLADTMKRRIVLWRLGRYTQLWAEAKALQTPRSTHSISDEFQKAYNTRHAIKLAEEGAYSKATQALRSDGILPPSQEITAAL